MDVPLEIRFHGMDVSPTAEALIRERVAKLEKMYPRLVSCRIGVEKPHRQHRVGNSYEVRIDMSVPGNELVVSKAPHHAHERYQNPELPQAINDAFDAAEKQLRSFKARQYGEVKPHDAPLTGTVRDVRPEADYGFLDSASGSQLWFHRNAVLDGDLDDLSIGDKVQYVETIGTTGPQASKVWRVHRQPPE